MIVAVEPTARCAEVARGAFRDGVRHNFQAARCREFADAGQLARLRHEALHFVMEQRPRLRLIRPRNVAQQQQPENMRILARKPDLAEWNTEFGDPSQRVDACRNVPHRVPRVVFVLVVRDVVVVLHAGGIHLELEARLLVVVRVDDDLDLIRVRGHIAAREQRDDAVRRRIVHAREDIEILVIVCDADVRLEARRLAFVGCVLRELIDDLGVLPNGIVAASVEYGWRVGSGGARGVGGGLGRHRSSRRANQRRAARCDRAVGGLRLCRSGEQDDRGE